VRNHSEDYLAWITAISGSLTVLVASYAGWQAQKIYKVEVNRDIEANRISCWAEYRPEVDPGGSARSMPFVKALVMNPTWQAIYDVKIYWHREGIQFQETDLGLVPPQNNPEKLLEDDIFDEIAHSIPMFPTVDHLQQFPFPEDSGRALGEEVASVLRISMTFRDNQGRKWFRDLNGILSQLNN
jgi:hypothetical protein